MKYPGLKLPSDFDCVLESEGGILLADKALTAVQVQMSVCGKIQREELHNSHCR